MPMSVTQFELEQDRVAAVRIAELEQEVGAEVSALVGRLRALTAQANTLRSALEDEAVATPALTGAVEDLEQDAEGCKHDLYRHVAHALNWTHSPFDVEAWCRRAEEMGAPHPRFSRSLIADLVRCRKVPNATFRHRYARLLEQGEQNAHELTLVVYHALRKVEEETGANCGAKSLVQIAGERVAAKPTILERLLGVVPAVGDGPSLRLFITYEQAVALARAFDMPPYQAGI